MTIKRNIEVEVDLTPGEMAVEFWELADVDQAAFFNALGKLAQHMLPMQFQSVQDCDVLNQDGRYAMRVIGDYSNMRLGEENV